MPIVPPSLDDRRFDDLVDELVARIPAHTPEWTNPRLADPGRTLIELFAWLVDTLLYRANLVPERQRLVFLKLLGMGLQPARAARAIVALAWASDKELGARTLQPGARVKAAAPFETLDEVSVLPLAAESYVKRRLTGTETLRHAELLQGLARVHSVAGAVAGYEALPVFAPGQADPGGIDVFGLSLDRALWIALLAPRAPQPAQQGAVNAAVKNALGGAGGAPPALLSVGVVPAISPPQPFDAQPSAAPSLPLLWELSTPGRGPYDTDYLALDVQSDTSAGLAHAGVLRLRLPDQAFLWAPDNDVNANPRAGVGDAPPRLDDAERAARLIAWLRLRPQPGAGVEHLRLAWLCINAVEIEQRVTQRSVVLGTSNGGADQDFALPAGNVDADTLCVEVEEPGGGYQGWQRVDDLAAIDADPHVASQARAYALDAEAGRLRFGDGVRARVPEAGMRVRLKSGRFGGGRAGNLAPHSLSTLQGVDIDGAANPAIQVTQPLAISGGDDAETLELAEKRISARLRNGDRAVTESDHRRLAFEARGIDVGRVEVLPRFKPRDRLLDAPGVVSVMALPAAALDAGAGASQPNPRPDRSFIERLHAHLAPRVPLATELYVIGCDYQPLAVSVAVSLRAGWPREQSLRDVRAALRRLLWPLAPGGPEGAGWPLRRPVRSRELEVEVARVGGVDEVRGLRLFGRRDDAWQALAAIAADGAQILELQPWQLPELLAVVAVEADAPPSDPGALPNPHADANAVAVPVVPDLCG